jgi:hypothetical protein
MNMTDIVIILGTSAAAILLVLIVVSIKTLRLRKKMKTLLAAYAKIELLINSQKDKESDNDVHKENFIKFLSDSRDWAYEYIETVQSGLNKFINEIEPEISYFDEYGVVGDAYPHYHSMKKISSEYKELKKLLPVEEKQ